MVGDMNVARSLAPLILVLLAGCSGPDATPDAGTPKGSWRLASETMGGSMTPDGSLDGTLVVGDAEYALATLAPLGGTITTYTFAAGGTALMLADGTSVPFTLSAGSAPQLTLQLTDRTLVFVAATDVTQTDAFPVRGTVTLADGAPQPTNPRVALVFLCRGMSASCLTSTGPTDTGFTNDVRDDTPLTFSGKTATFDLSRTRAALGTQRIPFRGVTAGISAAFVVVYDGSKAGSLQQVFAPCAGTTTGCPLGVAAVALGYRDGMTAALAASPYSYLRNGWTDALLVTDKRGGRILPGLVSGDAQKMLGFDVTVAADPSEVFVPRLDLTE